MVASGTKPRSSENNAASRLQTRLNAVLRKGPMLEFVEPDENDLAITRRLTEAEAIAQMRRLHDYQSDEIALEDFIAVYWARRV